MDMTQKQVVNLNGHDWQITAAAPGTEREQALLSPTWIPATVPGNVQSDVESAKLIKPIWYGPLDENMTNLALNDWWYQKEFTISEDLCGKRITLLFYGVEYSCDIYLNGKKVGRNEGTLQILYKRV